MAVKSGWQYADEVRELRAQGFDFPADRGYTLRNPAQWSSGLKGAVTHAFNQLEFEDDDEAPASELSDEDKEVFFDDAFGEPDEDDEFDDIAYFDFDEGDEFIDEESDQYEEVT